MIALRKPHYKLGLDGCLYHGGTNIYGNYIDDSLA